MYFPNRIYGLEFEYGVMNQDINGAFSAFDEKAQQQALALIMNPIGNSIFSSFRNRLWHSNGSCSYIDTGDHPEHATAECLSIRDAVIQAKVGDVLMNKIFARTSPSGKKIHLFKNNLAFNDATQKYFSFGCHENYHIAHKSLHVHPLVPFLITRQIIDGAGWWHKDPLTSDISYSLSQRALVIEREINTSTLFDRGILNNKETNDTGPAPRLHLILGDSNILEFAMYLKLGTVSLVLALIEGSNVPRIPLLDSVGILRKIALNGDPMEACVGTTLENSKSPFDVQTIYLEAARKELATGTFGSEETEAELKHVALCWEQVLNAIYNRDIRWMLGRIDHVTKKYLADREVVRKNITDPSEAFSFRKDFDIFYHNVTHTTLLERMNEKWADRRIVTDAEIERACIESPRNTRATLRSRFINMAIAHNLTNNLNVDWDHCRSTINPLATFNLPDPFVYKSIDFDDFLCLFPTVCNEIPPDCYE